MKTHVLSILLLAFCLYSCTSDSVEVQTLPIDGKSYEVASRSILNTQFTYLTLRENATSPAKSFLQTSHGLEPTVFSESELRSYLASGKLEDLGEVKSLPGSNVTSIQYVVKGNTNVFVFNQKGLVDFLEYEGPIKTIRTPISGEGQTNRDNGPTSPDDRYDRCLNRCELDLADSDCKTVEVCSIRLARCKLGCMIAYLNEVWGIEMKQ